MKQDLEMGTDHERFPVCPHCGYVHEDYYEMEEGDFECEDCEKTFVISIERELLFTTTKIKEESK